jgi:hypothetical protein
MGLDRPNLWDALGVSSSLRRARILHPATRGDDILMMDQGRVEVMVIFSYTESSFWLAVYFDTGSSVSGKGGEFIGMAKLSKDGSLKMQGQIRMLSNSNSKE